MLWCWCHGSCWELLVHRTWWDLQARCDDTPVAVVVVVVVVVVLQMVAVQYFIFQRVLYGTVH